MYARETQSHSIHTHYNYVQLVSHTITVQGIRNDDQSLSPVTPLVSLLFPSFLEMFRNIFYLLVDRQKMYNYSDDNRHGLTIGGSGHSAWEVGGESHNPDSVYITSSACDDVLRGIGTIDCNTVRVSPFTCCLIVDDVPSEWNASRWWGPRDSYGVAASENSFEASGWTGGSCGIHVR